MTRSSLAKWAPLMQEHAPKLTAAQRREIARMWDAVGYVLLPKQDLRNVELDAALVLQRRYLERRV